MAKQSRQPSFLLTRPAAQNARFAESLHTAFPGAAIISAPLLVPDFPTVTLPTAPVRALVFTSETGVAAYARLTPTARAALPGMAWCVGARTAAAARAAGLEARSADGDADALVAAITAAGQPGPLLHLHGQEVRGDVAARLNSAGIETFSVVAYRQQAQPLSPEAVQLLRRPGSVIVPLFSPRSAALFAQQCAAIAPVARLRIVAFSPAVAATIAALAAEAVTTAERPDVEAMLAALRQVADS